MNVVLVNSKAGAFKRDGADFASLRELALKHDGTASVLDCTAQEIEQHARLAVSDGVGTVIVCGGDGTVSAAASALAESDVALGVVPCGTCNHFARDAGLPSELDAAMAVAFGEASVTVDVGRCNGRVFVNNCSLGWYPTLIEERTRVEDVVGRWPAMTQAIGKLVQDLPMECVTLSVDGSIAELCETPVLFIGNNRYEFGLGGIGQRSKLDAGILSVYLMQARSQLELLGNAVQAVLVGPERAAGVQYMEGRRVVVTSDRTGIKVGIDGEATEIGVPLVFEVLARALRLRTRHDVSSASATISG